MLLFECGQESCDSTSLVSAELVSHTDKKLRFGTGSNLRRQGELRRGAGRRSDKTVASLVSVNLRTVHLPHS
jgi:hypothetical protein